MILVGHSYGGRVDVQTMWYCGILAYAASSRSSKGCSKHAQGCGVSRSAIQARSAGSVTP